MANWINISKHYYTTMLTTLVMKERAVSDMATELVKPSISEIFLGDIDQWISNILFCPFNLIYGDSKALYVGGQTFNNIDCYDIPARINAGLDLGEFKYNRKYNDFRDFEPYTKLQIYLPFYHYVDIPISEVIDKYIQFRLFVDFKTGKAVYVVGVTENSIERIYNFEYPTIIGVNDNNTRIIGRYEFQLCSTIPVGKTGMADAIRNMAIAGIRTVGNIASSYISSKANSTSTTTTTKNYNYKTSELLTENIGGVKSSLRETNTNSGKMNSVTTRNVSYQPYSNFNQCFNSSIDALQAMNLQANIGVANNTTLDSACPYSIKIVRKTSKMLDVDTRFNRLYGRPLGQVRYLSSLKGYTEISQIMLKGEEFKTITGEEMNMLNQILTGGIIL